MVDGKSKVNGEHKQTWPPWAWGYVEQQLLEFFARQEETHLVGGKGVTEMVVDRCERSQSGKSFRCPKCKGVKVDKYGAPCGHCGGKGLMFSFKATKNRVDFATEKCRPCKGAGKVLNENLYAALLLYDPDKCPSCLGKGYVTGYTVIPGPDAPGVVMGGDTAQLAQMLPIGIVLRRVAKANSMAHDVILNYWGKGGTECAAKCGDRSVSLWLNTREGNDILETYGDKKIVDRSERMVKLMKSKRDDLCEYRIEQMEKRVLQLLSAIKGALWRADGQTGFGVMREASRRAEAKS